MENSLCSLQERMHAWHGMARSQQQQQSGANRLSSASCAVLLDCCRAQGQRSQQCELCCGPRCLLVGAAAEPKVWPACLPSACHPCIRCMPQLLQHLHAASTQTVLPA